MDQELAINSIQHPAPSATPTSKKTSRYAKALSATMSMCAENSKTIKKQEKYINQLVANANNNTDNINFDEDTDTESVNSVGSHSTQILKDFLSGDL